VATHEAGHSLGLEHSREQDAIMYPWYQGTRDKNFDLRYDDIAGIQALYGARPKTTEAPVTKPPTTKAPITKKPTTKAPITDKPTTKAPVTEKPTTKAPITEKPTTKAPITEKPTTKAPITEKPTPKKYKIDCPSGIEAAVIDRSTGWMFAFYGKQFYLVSRRGVKYGPIKVKDYFKTVKEPVTAAYIRSNDGRLILFTGNKYYEYSNFYPISGPRPVSELGVPANSKVDAAFYWKGNGRLYIFVGTKYYKIDERRNKMERYYPRTISSAWRGLPSRVTAAVTSFTKANGEQGPTYFISNDKFYEFNDKQIQVQNGYPKHIKSWLLCNSNQAHPQANPAAGSLFEEPIEP